MASGDARALEDFLTKVDELESIVKGLKSENVIEIQDAMQKADSMLADVQSKDKLVDAEIDNIPEGKTGFNKTMINKKSTEESNSEKGMTREAFMAVLAEDAKERAEKRRLGQLEANKIKEQGNDEFRKGNFEKALDFYSKALEKDRGNSVLYTNRAQTYIRLGQYNEALKDCNLAIKVFPSCLKAYILMGKSYLALKHFQEARDQFQKAGLINETKESMFKEYMAEVDHEEAMEKQEQKAKQLFLTGDKDALEIAELLKKVKKAGHVPLYYSGGFRVLASVLTTTDNRSVFRSKNGLKFICDHPELSRCLSSFPEKLSQEELNMITASMDMYTMACTNNDANREHLLQTGDFPARLMTLLQANFAGQGLNVNEAMLRLLYTISLSDVGRSAIVSTFDNVSLLETLLQTAPNSGSTLAMDSLNNLSLHKKFRVSLKEKNEIILPLFQKLVEKPSTTLPIFSCISFMTNITLDKEIRKKLINQKDFWITCVKLLTQHQDRVGQNCIDSVISATLGLVLNMCLEGNQFPREFAVRLCKPCIHFIKACSCSTSPVLQHSLGVLGRILPYSIPAVDTVCENEGPKLFLDLLRHSDILEITQSAVKCLAACTQNSDMARKYIVDNKGLGLLMKLLNRHDEHLTGNSALCLGHCTNVSKVCAALVKTDIIKDLLVIARDGKLVNVQQNCAILVAKLAQGDPRHLERLRELHGIEILHTCMKHMS